MGQTDSVLIQHLVFDGSLDARMAKALVAKQAIADKALDNAIPELRVPVLPSRKGDIEVEEIKSDISNDQRVAALEAIRLVAGYCDGARAKDGSGFNRFDSRIGHSLATQSALTDGQTRLAIRLCRKYHRQIPDNLLSVLK